MENAVTLAGTQIKLILNLETLGVIFMDNYGILKCKHTSGICTDQREYLYDLKKHHGEVEDCIIFGLMPLQGKSILFHAIMENGAIFYRLPISAFIQKGFDPADVPRRRLDELTALELFSVIILLCILGIS